MNRLPLPTRTPTNEIERTVLAHVQQYGWHVILIPEDTEGPAFAYTIGLQHTFEHPELLLFGLPLNTMHAILNHVGSLIRAGQRFQDGMTSDVVLKNHNVVFGKVADIHYPEFLGPAMWFYQGYGFDTLQIIWPDRQNRFPWQQGFHEANRTLQPLLHE